MDSSKRQFLQQLGVLTAGGELASLGSTVFLFHRYSRLCGTVWLRASLE